MKTTAFVNAEVYTPRRIINGGTVIVRGRKILHVGPKGECDLAGAAIVDVRGDYLVPGFVDIHVHGGGGGDFIDARPSAVRAAARAHLLHGTTTLYASTSTNTMEQTLAALKVLRGFVGKVIPGLAFIPGVHMEGLFLTKAQPGCHNTELILAPLPRNTRPVMRFADIISRMTLAPEELGAIAFIRQLAGRGVNVAVGHSMATYAQVAEAAEAGASHVTHLYSAMSTVTRIQAKRHAGVLEAALEREDLTTEIIADGRHLPTSLMRLAYKCKGPENLCLVSDSMRALDMPEGRLYEVCGMKALYEDGVGYTPDKKAFASSVISMDAAVRHVVSTVGISLRDALTMASLTPARIMGIQQAKGQLRAGADADLIILRHGDLMPIYVMAMGRVARDDRRAR